MIYTEYSLILVGRVVFGLGGENCAVIQNAITAKWFKGKEINLALGINVTIARIGSVITSNLNPQIYDSFNNSLTACYIMGIGFVVFSWLCSVAMASMDKKNDALVLKNKGLVEAIETDKFELKDFKKFNLNFWMICLSCFLSYIGVFVFLQNSEDFF